VAGLNDFVAFRRQADEMCPKINSNSIQESS